MINTHSLLKSFDSSTLYIVDSIVHLNKKCILYSNGKIVYDNGKDQNILHIDITLCTGYGFVQSIDNIVRIYTCSKGIVTIYLIENNDVIRMSLPNSNYHIKNNSVKYFNDTYYLIAGAQTSITTQDLRDKINKNEIETVNIENIDYAIINSVLLYSVIADSNSMFNTGRSLVHHPIFGSYNIFDYSINSLFMLVICKNGIILYTDTDNNLHSTQISFFPTLDIKSIEYNLSSKIIDYTTFKMYDNPIDIINNRVKKRFFINCSDGSVRYCDILDNNMATIYYSNSEDKLNKKPIFISDVSYETDKYVHDTTFNNPDRVRFSKDGSKVIISRGKNGLILVDENSYRCIYKEYGFRDDCEVTSGYFSDNGYLFIALRKKGYVLRNIDKDNYTSFFDIVTTSMIVEDGRLDINTEVSNMVFKDDGILFYCQGSHERVDAPNTYIINSGLYHYNYIDTKLKRLESYNLDFAINDRRLFVTDDFIYAHENNFVIAKFNRFTFEKEYLSLTSIVGCKVWDIFEYKENIIFYISSPIDSTFYSNSLLSFSNSLINKSIQLGVISEDKDIIEIEENKYFSQYISFCQIYGMYAIILYRNSNSTITLISIHISGNIIKKVINIPISITKSSKISVDNFDKYIEFYLTSPNDKIEDTIYWRYNIQNDILEEINDNKHKSLETNTEDTIICKSLSTTNLLVSEGFISGDNCVSDFGAFNVRYNPDTLKSTRSFYTTQTINSPIDNYIDRITNQQVNIQSICTLKQNYTFILPIGIGRDDCKVYLAFDNVGDIKCIWEYSTNNNDIVDIFVKGSSLNLNDISGFNLLGSPSPGSTEFNNIDRWYVGDINNSVVGFRFSRDINNNKTKFIETIIFIGVKNKFIFQPTELNNIEIPNFVQILDDIQSNFKIYCEQFGQKCISIVNGECKIIDIFSRENSDTYIGRKVTTILDKNFNIKSDLYFKSKSSISEKQIKYVHNILIPSILPYERKVTSGIEIFNNDDDFYICSMIKKSISSSIEFMKFNPDDNGVDKVIIYIQFDRNYGNLKDNFNIKSLLSGFIYTKNGSTYNQLNFTIDPTNDLVYYAIIDNLSLIDLNNCNISLTNDNVSTHTTRFRIWSNTIFDNIINRTSIGPSALCQNVDLLLNTPLYGYPYNSIRISQNDGLIPKTIIKNVLSYINNSTLQLKVIPDSNGWLISDVFDILSINDYTLSLQLSSVSSNNLDINCKIYGSSIPESSINLIKDEPIIFKIKFENNTISVKLIQDTNEIIICTDLAIIGDVVDYSILDFFFGKIENITIIEDILDYSSINEINYIGDNVYGQVVSMIRDYESGLLHALVSPSFTGTLRDKGILEYKILQDSSIFLNYKTEIILNDLKYGKFGFYENSVFILMNACDINNDYINIFKRKYIGEVEKFTSPYLKSINDDFIIDCNNNKIIVSEYKL